MILLHELGHAIAVRARGLPLRELKVGDDPVLTVRTGSFRLELGRLVGKGDVGGYVFYDGHSATPLDVLAIALAGPAANLIGAGITAVLTAALWSHGGSAVILALMTLSGLCLTVANLRPSADQDAILAYSDGQWAQLAWRAHRARAVATDWTDPNIGTSIAPPTPAHEG